MGKPRENECRPAQAPARLSTDACHTDPKNTPHTPTTTWTAGPRPGPPRSGGGGPPRTTAKMCRPQSDTEGTYHALARLRFASDKNTNTGAHCQAAPRHRSSGTRAARPPRYCPGSGLVHRLLATIFLIWLMCTMGPVAATLFMSADPIGVSAAPPGLVRHRIVYSDLAPPSIGLAMVPPISTSILQYVPLLPLFLHPSAKCDRDSARLAAR
mmetsp:Transcript_21147/g.48949  ORF Transcript_21147/g.48949 Transcript_21147/m.48949 type:complete len:212 (-) Transcript_21147:303-938(-)